MTWNDPYAITTLPEEYVVRSVLADRVSNGFSEASVISFWATLLRDLALPSVPELLQDSPVSLRTWKKSLKKSSYPGHTTSSSIVTLAFQSLKSFLAGKVLPHWAASKGNRDMMISTNFRMRLLVGVSWP